MNPGIDVLLIHNNNADCKIPNQIVSELLPNQKVRKISYTSPELSKSIDSADMVWVLCHTSKVPIPALDALKNKVTIINHDKIDREVPLDHGYVVGSYSLNNVPDKITKAISTASETKRIDSYTPLFKDVPKAMRDSLRKALSFDLVL